MTVSYVTVNYDWVGRLRMLFPQQIGGAPGAGGEAGVGSTVPQGKRQLLTLEVAGFFLAAPARPKGVIWSLCV